MRNRWIKSKSPFKVCMLVRNDVSRDARVRKEARSLSENGYDVTIMGVGDSLEKDLGKEKYKVVLSSFAGAKPNFKGKPLIHPLGRESVFYPLRVFANSVLSSRRVAHWENRFSDDLLKGYYPDYPEVKQKAIEIKPDVVHCHDLDTLWVGYKIAQKSGALLVYDSHELYLEQHSLPQEARELFSKVEEKVFPYIDAFVTVSPMIGDILTKKYSSNLEPVVLYNGSDTIVSKITPAAKPVELFFQGFLAPDRNNLELVSAMKELRGKARLTLQGWGGEEQEIRELIKREDLSDFVKVIPPCPPAKVVESASGYDVGIINSIAIDKNFSTTLPNKLFDYMSAGLAIASTNLPSIKAIIDETKCGITYDQRGIQNTARVLCKLVNDPVRLELMKKASLVAAPQFSWFAQEEKLLALYKKMEGMRRNKKYG